MPIFLALSRPIPLTKLFDITDFKDVTHFSVNPFEESDIIFEEGLYVSDHSKEARLEFLDLISTFKVKRSLKKDYSLPSYNITFYQNKYKSQGKYKLGVLNQSGSIDINITQYKIINYEELLSKINDFIKNH